MLGPSEIQIADLVRSAVERFAREFCQRHREEAGDAEGTINLKVHNVFVAELGSEIRYYTALARSLDSSLGNMLETLALAIARLSFEVQRSVEGPLSDAQINLIAALLESYKRGLRTPYVADYVVLRDLAPSSGASKKRHESDYYLIDPATTSRYLIELKIGGDLDSKKARSEKEAILEQYAILSNTLPRTTDIRIYFATAYNRYGEGRPWKQERVRQFFAEEELLIGRDFWNFVCRSPEGYDTVIAAYRDAAPVLRSELDSVKAMYLGV